MKHKLFTVILLSLLLFSFQKANAQKPYKNAVKLTFLSWTSGSTKISYERAFADIKQSAEICGSVIGAGYDSFIADAWVGGGYAFGTPPRQAIIMDSNFGTGSTPIMTI